MVFLLSMRHAMLHRVGTPCPDITTPVCRIEAKNAKCQCKGDDWLVRHELDMHISIDGPSFDDVYAARKNVKEIEATMKEFEAAEARARCAQLLPSSWPALLS